jgi:hypothetical protein
MKNEMIKEAHAETARESQGIPINGFQQIVDMLKVADPQFRESLLRRLAARDPALVNSLRRDLETSELEY